MSPKEQIPWDDDEDQLFGTDPLMEAEAEDEEASEEPPAAVAVPATTPPPVGSQQAPLKAPVSAHPQSPPAVPLPPSSVFEAPASAGEAPETSGEAAAQGGSFAWEAEGGAGPTLLDDSDETSALQEKPAGDYTEADFDDQSLDDEEEEAITDLDVQKIGIVGGKGVGKSYLFQAMVYRTSAGKKSGALAYYLEKDAIRLFSALQRDSKARTMNLVRFVEKFQSWERLDQTKAATQRWYRLELPYRTGLFGNSRGALEVEFFDGSGDLMQAPRGRKTNKLWREGYLDARVMVFCLPIWAAFPDSGLSQEDWQDHDDALVGFEQVVQNYIGLRASRKRPKPVQAILALTMADDRRSALKTLRDRWMTPYMDSPETYLRQLRTGSGVARYLANAQRISEALHEEFTTVKRPTISGIPQKLDFGAGEPWIVPVSAIEGDFLSTLEEKYPGNTKRPRLAPPVPVHVELPLLVALCERSNALM